MASLAISALRPVATPARTVRRTVCRAAESKDVTGITFQPFEAVQSELSMVSSNNVHESFARLHYHPECEAAVNEQINVRSQQSLCLSSWPCISGPNTSSVPHRSALARAAYTSKPCPGAE